MLSPRRSPLSSAFLSTSASSIAVIVLTFVSGVIVSRMLGPEGRGEYGTYLLLAQTAASVGCLSYFDGVVVELKTHARRERAILPTMFLSAIGLSVFVVAIALPLFYLFAEIVVGSEFYFFAVFTALIITFQLIIQSFSAFDRSRFKFGMINTARFLAPATFCILLILTLWLSDAEFSAPLVLTLFLASKLPELAPWIFVNRASLFGPISWSFVKASASTGLKFHAAFALTAIASQVDRLLVIGTWSAEMLGLYFVAFSAVGAGYSVLTTAMNTVMLPYFTRLHESERQEKIAQSLRLSIVLVVFVTLVGAVVLPFAIPAMYGEEFQSSVGMALGILFAMTPMPFRIIIAEVGRSKGVGLPSVEMAIITLVVMFAGWLLTGYRSPPEVIFALGLANFASVIFGMIRMARSDDFAINRGLVPGPRDLKLILTMISGHWK